MKFYEWVNLFETKTGEKFYIPPGYELYFDEDKGFMVWKNDNGIFRVDQTSTSDYLHMVDFAFNKANELGCETGETRTRRNAKAFAKLFNAEVVLEGYDLETGIPTSIIRWKIDDYSSFKGRGFID